MIECPLCCMEVEMIDDSHVTGESYQIFLECPNCEWRLCGTVPLGDLERLKPMEEM